MSITCKETLYYAKRSENRGCSQRLRDAGLEDCKMWQSQYGTRDHDDAEDDFEVIYQRGFIAQYDPSIFRLKRPISAVRCWFITAAIIVSVAVVTILSISLASPDESQSIVNRSDFSFLQSADQSKSAATCSRDAISLSVSNEYGTYTGPYPYLTANGGMQLVEPYKATTLVLNDPSSCIRTGATLQWQIFDSESKELIFFTKSNKLSTSIKLVRTGNYEIVVKLSSRSSTPTIFFTGKITCKYVKRELRELTLSDRNRFLDAAIVLWKVDTATGREKYGAQYTSIASFVEEHALASNDIRCDAYHEGTGFLTHHLALQNSFEASLRAVDPTVTTPYWDFSIEGEKILEAGRSPSYLATISPVFTDEWFGSVDAQDHIVDSRWAHISMPKTSKSSVVNPNSYGYVRSYWNNNNDPEVTRHMFDVCGIEPTYKTVPACDDHFGVINSPSLGIFQMTSPGHGHGPLHVLTGGVGGGCVQGYAQYVEKHKTMLYANISDEEILAKGFEVKKVRQFGLEAPRKNLLDRIVMGEYFHAYRSLWRSHMCSRDSTPQLLQCPAKCSQETPVEQCACTVPGLEEGSTDWRDVYHCIVKEDRRPFFDAFFTFEMLRDLVIFVANTPLVEGEMLEAASPADIMFWMIHPAIERLLAAKRLSTVHTFGGKEISKWDASSEVWMAYSYYSLAAGQNPTYPEAFTCKGHEAEDHVLPDVLPFIRGFQKLADANGDGVVTNWEYYQAIDPNNVTGVDYVFSNFDWSHCFNALPVFHSELDD